MRIEVKLNLDFDDCTIDDLSQIIDSLGESTTRLVQDIIEDATMADGAVLDGSSVEVRRVWE